MRGAQGEMVRLGDVATVRERDVLARINRGNQQYERTVAYEFRDPVRLGDVVQAAVLENTHVPPGYTIVGRQEFRMSTEDRRQIYTVLALGLVLVFMLTAALFESIRQPLCVLLTVPMALVGVFLVFYRIIPMPYTLIVGDRMYAVVQDELDVPVIVRYHIGGRR